MMPNSPLGDPDVALLVAAITPLLVADPITLSLAPGLWVPIPILPDRCTIAEFPSLVAPVQIGMWSAVPEPVTWAAAEEAQNRLTSPHTALRIFLCRFIDSPPV